MQKQTIMRTLSLLLFIFSFQAFAQAPSVPSPGKAQNKTIVLQGGTAHIGNGKVIENSVIVLKEGKITAVGEQGKIDITKDAEIIQAIGKHIYPGLIAANTTLGLSEIASIRATRDYAEVGSFNPNVRSIIAYNTDSKVTPTVRSNGILLAQVVPQSGRVSGQSSVVQLDGWNWEDAAYKMDDGIFVSWPTMYRYRGWWANPGGIVRNKNYEETLTNIKDLLQEAKAHCDAPKHATKNLKLDAMCGLFDGSKTLFIRANYIKEIIDAVNLTKGHGAKIVIVGGKDAWIATDILKENNISVLLNKTHDLPNRADEDVDLPYKLPKILQDAGVTFALTVGTGWDGYWDQRNLAFEAGTAVTYGLTKEEALATITSNAAKILGIDDKVGTLEVGKEATLLVAKGDILDMRTSHVEHAFIQGRAVNLDNKQKALYRKFMDKYELEHKQH